MADEFVPGLAGVVAAKSAISFIDGQQGILQYRGIPIQELAENATFEEVAYLLLFGELPKRGELESFSDELRSMRELPPAVQKVLEALPGHAHPMVALQAAVAALGACHPMDVSRRDRNRRAAIRLIAMTPTIVAAFDRLRKGRLVVAPHPDLCHAANFMYMMTGFKPDPQVTRIMDLSLVLHAEHGFNASTFTGRVIASSLANPYSAISGAVGSLSGPLHGAANERVLQMLRTVPEDNVEAWLDDMIERKQKIMGLGHRVYKVKDPRADVLQALALKLVESTGSTPIFDIARKIELLAVDKLGPRGIYPNVDFFSGIVYEKLAIEVDLFTPIFAISRVAGWVAHWLEQLEDNRLFRPTQKYVGKRDERYVDIDLR